MSPVVSEYARIGANSSRCVRILVVVSGFAEIGANLSHCVRICGNRCES